MVGGIAHGVFPRAPGPLRLSGRRRGYYQRQTGADVRDRLLYVGMMTAIWGNDLPKVLTAARVADVRVRFAFLDPELATFTGTLRPDLKVRGLEKRYLFKGLFCSVENLTRCLRSIRL